jgi:uncharacterized membrane protein
MLAGVSPLESLALATAVWISLHVGLAGSPLRPALAARIGERGFAGLFSLLSLGGLAWLLWAYHVAARPGVNHDLWPVARWMLWAPFVVMPAALVLFVGSVTVASPTSVGAEKLLARPEPAVGVLRITRHPMLWSFALWAAAHALANSDAATLWLCAAIGAPALLGMASIDRKRARQDPEGWARFARVTSIVPFAAIAGGRNRLVAREIGAWRIALALAVWGALLAGHEWLYGASPLPW